MYTMLDEQGRARHPAADEEGHPHATHPITGVEITGYARVMVGDGIEKKEEDFAAEVAKTLSGA